MSSYGLSSETKKAIKSTVLGLRKLLEGKFDPDTGELIPPGGDVARQISRYGILVDKPESLKSENAPEYLTDAEKKKRERICASIKREVSIFGKLSDKTALRRGMRAFIRQTSYTWVNRLLGLRCMEARGLLKDDRGELDFVVTPSDDYGGLPRRAWRIKGEDPAQWQTAKLYDLQCEAIADACRQLTQEIKVLFDPEHDYGLIWPSPPALNILLQKIQELDKTATPSPFTSPDFLGWVYQYFQTIEKDLVFEAASKKKKKIEKDDIIPATQIYTEHYMVEYLVQNSLGRLWMEMHPDSKLSAKWAYYVKPPEENQPVERELKKAIEIKLMDPAVGSGHFHLVAFDLLLSMYEEEIEKAGQPGWPETPSVKDDKDIPASILQHNLFGIDIDARSIQLASLVLVMKAREAGYEGPISHFNLVVANSAPFESEAWYQFIQELKDQGKHSVARVLAALGLQLKNLDEFGSLLRIEDEMQKVIQEEKDQWIAQARAGMHQEYLFPEMAKPRQEKLPFETAITDETFFDRLGSVIEEELDAFYFKARQEGLAEEAILAADAERGFDFLRLSMQRHDVVYTNPPYMGSKNMGDRLKKFVASAYPQGKRDLYAAFVMRCRELSKENGHVGMVTQQSWMFLKSYENLRALPEEKLKKAKVLFTGFLRETSVETLSHLGYGAFSEISGAVVNIALFTFRNVVPVTGHRMVAFRLVGAKSPEKKKELLIQGAHGHNQLIVSKTRQSDLLSIVGSPFAYWLTGDLYDVMRRAHRLEALANAKHGLSTADNERFLRYVWETPYNPKVWFPHAKGGGYARWNGLDYLNVNWEKDGFEIKKLAKQRYPYLGENLGLVISDEASYKLPGITYSMMAQGSLGARYLGVTVFGHKGPTIFPKTSDSLAIWELMGLLNCRVASFLLRVATQSLDFSIGYVSNMSLPLLDRESWTWGPLCKHCYQLKSYIVARNVEERLFEITREEDFFGSGRDSMEAVMAILNTIEGLIEAMIFDAYGILSDGKELILAETGIPAGWYPLIAGYDNLPELPAALPPIQHELIDYVSSCDHVSFSPKKLKILKKSLQALYVDGAGVKIQDHREHNINNNGNDEHSNSDAFGARIPIPTETYIEELSQKLQIHPISVYWLLKEMREEEGLVYPSEIRRDAEDYVSVMILRMLGYQWQKQVEEGEPLPDWADDDGIIPRTEGLGESTLLDQIRKRFGVDFGEEKEASVESEFANIVGKPLERWLEEDFFARHVKQFKNRPIAWHIVSNPHAVNQEAGSGKKGRKKGARKKLKPAFSVMVHYHRFVDGEKGYGKLLLLKNKYLEKLMSQTRSELESLRGKGDDPKIFDRIAELDRRLVELEDFRERLERIQEGKDRESRIFVRWKSSEEQPQGWRPDINDGVKINIAPWERLGMFPVKKIVGKVEMAPE